MPHVSVVISHYKKLHNLQLILQGLAQQSDSDFEAIVSEDDNNPETRAFLNEHGSSYSFPIQHLHQEVDDGFRKNQMLNRSIVAAKGKVLAFLDGDCIPHKHFVKEHKKRCKNGRLCIGRTCLLDGAATSKAYQNESISHLHFFGVLFSKTERKKDSIYFPFFRLSNTVKPLIGRNWSATRDDLMAVNGFDEDYTSAGVGEDTDIEWRLRAHGLMPYSMQNKSIIFHLYHKRWYNEEQVQANFTMMHSKQKAKHVRCLNGIEKR